MSGSPTSDTAENPEGPDGGRDLVSFAIDGFDIAVPRGLLSPKLALALAEGRYERQERRALTALVRPGDRVLDIGAGAGLVTLTAARAVGAAAVTAVEAHPGMIAALRRNLDTNRAAEVTVLYGAAVAKPVARGIVPFHARPAFWASSVQSGQGGPTTVAVPALPFAELVAASRPSVVAMDVEGAEVELLAQALPDGVRAVVVEMHPRATGPAAVASAEAILAAQGFRSLARLARGGVRAWTRAG